MSKAHVRRQGKLEYNIANGDKIIESPVAEAPQYINKIPSEEMHYSPHQ